MIQLRTIFFGLLLLCAQVSYAQIGTKRSLKAHQTAEKIVIDGKLDEAAWSSAEFADSFTTLTPYPLLKHSQRTEVRVMYDAYALYIGAYCYDSAPDSILTLMSQRDQNGNSDWFQVLLDTYKDGNNAFGFGVTVNNVQIDKRISANQTDFSWDAVWESKTSITDKGWIAEIRIPFSAIRFSEADIQTWGINFSRDIRRNREEGWWNTVDPNVNGLLLQSGYLTELKHLKPGVRFMIYPYASTQSDILRSSGSKTTVKQSFQGGADLKIGLNEAFTLDMTTIPDFRQVKYDNQVLNLSPFEVRFSEFRQFFTEGTELFNKADLFYSRRIGGNPLGMGSVYSKLNPGETVSFNPTTTQLINSTKVSGRTQSGLGVGVMNSMVAASNATVVDSFGNERSIETSPFTNYNILVFDQNLKNNSFVSLVNTNTYRVGDWRKANVTGSQFKLLNKKNTHFVAGTFAYSSLMFPSGSQLGGIKSNWNMGKSAGKVQWRYSGSLIDNKYNQNDLGFLTNNNIFNNDFQITINDFKRKKWLFGKMNINRLSHTFNATYSRIYQPFAYSNLTFSYNLFGFAKSFTAFGGNLQYQPFVAHDYFEPRTPGRFLQVPQFGLLNAWISTNYNKKFAIDMNIALVKFNQAGRNNASYSVDPRFRIGSKTMLLPTFQLDILNNDVGFVYKDGLGNITVGRRRIQTFEQVLAVSHAFNAVMVFNFRLRHYWSTATYNAFYDIQQDGSFGTTSYVGFPTAGRSIKDISYNAFTIDAEFKWRFAPGSDLLIVWKNALFHSDPNSRINFTDNLNFVYGAVPHQNSISVKVLYFIDYQRVKAKIKR